MAEAELDALDAELTVAYKKAVLAIQNEKSRRQNVCAVCFDKPKNCM